MRKTVKWTALFLAVMMLTGCAQKAERKAPELLEPAGVTANVITHTAYIDDIYKFQLQLGTVEPYVEPLFFNVNGEVEAIHAYPGMNVKKGDALIELDQENLQARADQLTQDISYTQQDGEYSDEITGLEIKILETELKQLQKTETGLKEKETELNTKKTELEAKIGELKEKETALMQSTAVSEESETESEESSAASEENETESEESSAASEESETETESEESSAASEESETESEESSAAPEESKPEENTPVPNESELALIRAELTLAEAELTTTNTELTQVETDIPSTEKEIALKKNEITQKQTLLRQSKEQRNLELSTKRKELSEVNTAIEENVMYAPFDGKIVYSSTLKKEEYARMKPGSWVQAESPVLYLADDSRLTIKCPYITEFTIESADRIYAQIGSKEYEIKYVPIDQDTLMAMSIAGEEIFSTFEFVASEKEMKEIAAGQSVSVFILSNYEKDALVVPSHAVLFDTLTRTKYVYVDENGSRVRRDVKTGTITESRTQILEGLEEGDVVHVDK